MNIKWMTFPYFVFCEKFPPRNCFIFRKL